MKNLKITIAAMAFLFATAVTAQTENNEEIAKVTTEKSYIVDKGGETVKNSVRITTQEMQQVKTKKEDYGQVNQERILPPKKIIKTVEIDNDSDDAYDEIIEFSYVTEIDSDFTLISDDDNLWVAVANGENLQIMKDMKIGKETSYNPERAYVFTNDNGKEVKFYISSVDWDYDSNKSK